MCRRRGISRPTLRKWWRRYQSEGEKALQEQSRRPHNTAEVKVTGCYEALILEFRLLRNLGARRIQAELIRHHNFKLSTRTIERVLERNQVPSIRRYRKLEVPHRYSRPVPGERVQLDTRKIANRLYRHTAIDDCTRFRVLGLYPRRTAKNSVLFLENRMIEEFPFPIQRIQTDRGPGFFGLEFQAAMKRNRIKFRPIRPRSPHLNGKVERSQMTDKIEFYPSTDVANENLADSLEQWQFDYNGHRPNNPLGGKTPLEKVCGLLPQTPLREEIDYNYDPSKERFQERDYKREMLFRKLK